MFCKRIYPKVVALNLILIVNGYALSGEPSALQPCVSLLPKEGLKKITISFKDWRILEKNDIDSDDQILWDKAHGGECPGVAVGDYDGSKEKQYAILIIPKDSVKRQFKLLLLKNNPSEKYTIRTIYEADNAGDAYPVIYTGDSGTYSDLYDENTKVEVNHDAIICEFIEKGAFAFYYKKGKYKKLLISD